MDQIFIKGLEVFANHGVYKEEQEKGQKFLVNATLYFDTAKAGRSDELTDSVDYGKVCQLINDFMTQYRMNLLETIANRLARKILMAYPELEAVTLEIEKPQAPIPLPFDNVSVKIHRSWHTAFIAFGSNMGDRMAYINDAIANLKADMRCEVKKVSKFVESKPYGGVEQDNFYNGVLELRTLLEPKELLEFLQAEEKHAGRVRKEHWGPRTLDLDILYFDDMVIETDSLTIPHVDMQYRDFVLVPLNEIAPYKRHPLIGLTTKEMLRKLKDSYVTQK
ncbi:MAG: 2-amino-4-hydroxy-6-hydroxymethyldihydropteridine diphosphokinase [Lachnospiraceae bacterium]|nr:2-amino-4-hydroxy-6-hydroxymethyldihydropteridine diphosphokinase [Lachnospiraceae bacterium]MBQ7833402.1 2-amino-4-hydroxy-6-hydroxymethyldihydropteridine diphosphokinase [Lachnospiraceae bacterium]